MEWSGQIDRLGRKIWKIKVPTKVQAFMWLTVNNIVLTWDNLQQRG